MGANADCKPEYIVQFANMGCAYARVVLGVDRPRVGLLNIGSEDTKGSRFAQDCFAALHERVPEFAGNAEGVDLFAGTFDVVVTDGFTGNAVLKSVEGTARYIMREIKAAVMSSLPTKIAGKILQPSLAGLRDGHLGGPLWRSHPARVKGVVAIATAPRRPRR